MWRHPQTLSRLHNTLYSQLVNSGVASWHGFQWKRTRPQGTRIIKHEKNDLLEAEWCDLVFLLVDTVVVLSSPSYTLTHNLQLTQTCCRCLHSRRNRTTHTDPMNSRTSSVERSRSTNLPPSPTVNTSLQLHSVNVENTDNLIRNIIYTFTSPQRPNKFNFAAILIFLAFVIQLHSVNCYFHNEVQITLYSNLKCSRIAIKTGSSLAKPL